MLQTKTETLPPLIFDVHVPRFDVKDEAKAACLYLAEQGFVVFRSVLNDSEVQRALSLIWDALEGLGRGINRNDPRTWASRIDAGRRSQWDSDGSVGDRVLGRAPRRRVRARHAPEMFVRRRRRRQP